MSGVNNVAFTNEAVTASAATITVPAGAKGAIITVQTAPVCFRMDGTAPVAAAGSSTVLNVGDWIEFDSWTYPGNNWKSVLRAIQFKEYTVTDAVLAIEWFD